MLLNGDQIDVAVRARHTGGFSNNRHTLEKVGHNKFVLKKYPISPEGTVVDSQLSIFETPEPSFFIEKYKEIICDSKLVRKSLTVVDTMTFENTVVTKDEYVNANIFLKYQDSHFRVLFSEEFGFLKKGHNQVLTRIIKQFFGFPRQVRVGEDYCIGSFVSARVIDIIDATAQDESFKKRLDDLQAEYDVLLSEALRDSTALTQARKKKKKARSFKQRKNEELLIEAVYKLYKILPSLVAHPDVAQEMIEVLKSSSEIFKTLASNHRRELQLIDKENVKRITDLAAVKYSMES